MATTKNSFFTTANYESSEDEERTIERHEKKQNRQAADLNNLDAQARMKRQEPFNKKLKNISEKAKISDYNSALNELNSLISEFEKSRATVEKDGYPALLFKTLIDLEEGTNELTSKEKTRLSKENKNALSKLKQKVKKLLDDFSGQVENYKKNPDELDYYETSSEDEYYSVEEEPEPAAPAPNQVVQEAPENDDEIDSQSWDADLNQDDNITIQDTNPKNRAAMSREERRKTWLKAPDELKKVIEIKVRKEQVAKTTQRSYKIQEVDIDFSGISLAEDSISRRLKEIGSSKSQMTGLKLQQNISMLLYILNNIKDKRQRVELLIVLLNLKSELMRSENLFLERSTWAQLFEFIQEYQQVLLSGPSFLDGEIVGYLKQEEEKYTKRELESLLVSQLTFLDNEWLVLIRNSDPESFEYANILREEMNLVKLLLDTLKHFEKKKDNPVSCVHLAYKILEHVYFLSDHTLNSISKISPDYILASEPRGLVERLTSFIYNKIKDSSLIAKTGLLEAFNHAINDRYIQAKDLLLMFNVPEKPIANDPYVGYYFNRAMAVTGLCAFRKGNTEDCQDTLEELCGSGKLKDLLNQTSVKGYTEMSERKNLVPYHMSLSSEAIESAYFVSVMLNEAPQLAGQLNGEERKPTSKLFQKLWQFYEKNPLTGPPENHRDTIYCAVKELFKGEWKQCVVFISQLKIWSKIANAEEVKKKYEQLIKQQAFKTFISSIKNSFHVLKFERLAQLFDSPASVLVSLTCEMIYLGEISAKLDPQSGCLITGKRELADIESLSERVGQKVYSLMGINEKLFDVKFSNVNFSELISAGDNLHLRSQKRTKTST